MERGILYGVGVGPGDPELLTIKACRIINETRYIALPGAARESSRSYQTVEPVMNCPEEKEYICCGIEMTKNKAVLAENYGIAAEKICRILDLGENVAFLTIGDPTVYSTYMCIHRLVEAAGYSAEIINGIPSFCAAAARLGISLCERSEQVHIIPSSYDIDAALDLPGTKVLMKSGGCLPAVKAKLQSGNSSAYMVENCCMDNERLFMSASELDEHAGYLSLIIAKDP